VNFSKGFSCTKVNLGLFLRREKKEDYVMARKKQKKNLRMGRKAHNYGKGGHFAHPLSEI